MKRGGPSHPKTLELAAKMGLEVWQAVGLLESLWHFSAQYARRGDIGRHSDAAIVRAIGYGSDSYVLVKALVEAGFLDPCPCHRLRVHDWPDHADQAVSKTKEVVTRGFLECYEAIPRIEAAYPKDSAPRPSVGKGTGNREQVKATAPASTGTKEPPKEQHETWLTPYVTMYRKAYGVECVIPFKHWAKQLAPARAQIGDVELQRRFGQFCDQTEGRYASVKRFLEILGTFGPGNGGSPRGVAAAHPSMPSDWPTVTLKSGFVVPKPDPAGIIRFPVDWSRRPISERDEFEKLTGVRP